MHGGAGPWGRGFPPCPISLSCGARRWLKAEAVACPCISGTAAGATRLGPEGRGDQTPPGWDPRGFSSRELCLALALPGQSSNFPSGLAAWKHTQARKKPGREERRKGDTWPRQLGGVPRRGTASGSSPVHGPGPQTLQPYANNNLFIALGDLVSIPGGT